MATALIVIVVALVGGLAFLQHRRVPRDARGSRGGWYGLGLLALLFSGLWGAGRMGNEAAAYGFGIAMVIVAGVMVLVGMVGAATRALHQRKQDLP